MMQQTVYDLMTCRPHVPDDARFTEDSWRLYNLGYQHALVIVLKALKATEARFDLVQRTKRLDQKRRKGDR
jgi:hypothetical protein